MTVGAKLSGHGAGRDLVAGDVVLGAGWGGTATFAIKAGSNRARGRIDVTASATTPAQATATVTVTFPEPYDEVPTVVVARDTSNESTNGDLVDNDFYLEAVSTTAFIVQSAIIPVAAKISGIAYIVVE